MRIRKIIARCWIALVNIVLIGVSPLWLPIYFLSIIVSRKELLNILTGKVLIEPEWE